MCLHVVLVDYKTKLLTPCCSERPLRSTSLGLLTVPKSRLTAKGDRIFTVHCSASQESAAEFVTAFKSCLLAYFYRLTCIILSLFYPSYIFCFCITCICTCVGLCCNVEFLCFTGVFYFLYLKNTLYLLLERRSKNIL